MLKLNQQRISTSKHSYSYSNKEHDQNLADTLENVNEASHLNLAPLYILVWDLTYYSMDIINKSCTIYYFYLLSRKP